MDYQIKIRSRPGLHNWSKVTRFLLGQEPAMNSTHTRQDSADIRGETGNVTKTLQSYHPDSCGIAHPLHQVSVRHSPSSSSVDEMLSLEDCWESLGDGFMASRFLTATIPFRPTSSWGELEMASIQASIARDDDTTESEIHMVEQLKARRTIRLEDGKDDTDSTSEPLDGPMLNWYN